MPDEIKKLIIELEKWGAEPQQVLSETFMNDYSFYKNCLDKFSNDTLLQTLNESLVPDEIETAIRAVHTIKGNADSLGLFPILDAAMTVLKDLRTGSLSLAIADMPELEAVIAEFREILAPYINSETSAIAEIFSPA